MEELFELVEKLMLLHGISGYESEVADFMLAELKSCTDTVNRDRSGNVVGVIEGKDPEAYKTMLVGHMDQIGMVVTCVCDDGLIRVTKNGSIPDKVLPGCELVIRKATGGYLPAVVGMKPYHTMTAMDKAQVEPLEELYVDIGASSKGEAFGTGVLVGCAVQYKPNFVRLMGNRFAGTAIDNRVSCALLIACARYLYTHRPQTTVYFSATVQEEHNLRGGMLVARQIHPDIAICLDVTHDSSQPWFNRLHDNPIGRGPTISLYSFHGRGTLNGTIAHEGLVHLAQLEAKKLGISVSRFAMRGMLTDAAYIQLEGCGGVATVDMGFPSRYVHSPAELCDMGDVEELKQLLCGMLCMIDKNFSCYRF